MQKTNLYMYPAKVFSAARVWRRERYSFGMPLVRIEQVRSSDGAVSGDVRVIM